MTLAWPLPALLAWALAWALHLGLMRSGASPWLALGAALGCSLLCSRWGGTRWRQAFIAAGYPLSLLAVGPLTGAWPAWVWLLPLAVLALVYPVNAWTDAPLFPTPVQALKGLARRVSLPAGARVADAGCGLGDGLRELHTEYPEARLIGWEWSWPLTLACRWRCRFAQVSRQDIWRADWSTLDMVYLFQRPESMPRAMAKAQAELRPGCWLVSLEFEAAGWAPQGQLQNLAGKPVWLYQAPFRAR